jgi:hypothetical protein
MPIDMEVQEFDILDWYQKIPLAERIYSHPMIKKQIESLNLINTIRNSNHIMYKAALCFSYDLQDTPYKNFDSEYNLKVQNFVDSLDSDDLETKTLVMLTLTSESIRTAMKSLAFVRLNSKECYDITISILSKIDKKPFSTIEMADCYTEKMKDFLEI